MNFGLTEQALSLIRGVFALHPEVTAVKVFGSRAQGTARPNSDIDLVLWGPIGDPLLGHIITELDELPLPYQFDVILYDRIVPQSLKDHIDQCALPLGAD